MTDRAWYASLGILAAASIGAFLALRAAGLDDGRALGVVILFLVALLPCTIILCALALACRWKGRLAALVAAGALLAGLVTTGVLLSRGGAEDSIDTDRQGPHLNL